MTIHPYSAAFCHRHWPIKKKKFCKKTVKNRVTIHGDRQEKGLLHTAGKY